MTDDPVARAKADRSRRQIAAIASLAGAGGKVLGGTRDRMADQANQDAEITRLRAMLGAGADESAPPAAAEAPYAPGRITEEALPPAAPAQTVSVEDSERGKVYSIPEAEPGSDQGVLSRAAERFNDMLLPFADKAQEVGGDIAGAAAGPLASLARIGDTALIQTGLKPDNERASRLQMRGQLAGRVGREGIHQKRLASLSRMIGFTKDPGALMQKVYPELGVGAGDIQITPRTATTKPSQWSDVLASVGGDVPKALALLKDLHGGKAGDRSPNLWSVLLQWSGGDLSKALTKYAELQKHGGIADDLASLEAFMDKQKAGGASPDESPPAPGLRGGKGGRFNLEQE